MVRGILFDVGGTLDGDGQHWLERFVALYRAAGVTRPRETLRRAFDAAERRAADDDVMAAASFGHMVERHVGWQLDTLALAHPALQNTLVDGFVAPARAAAAANAALLAELRARGFRLGVVSNGCGNVATLCDEFGWAPSLDAVVDSRRVGLAKPDPAIFAYAAARLELDAVTVLMVGDSFDRDVTPARRAGLRTAWLEGPVDRPCPDPALVDIRLRRLADLLAVPALRAPAEVPAAS